MEGNPMPAFIVITGPVPVIPIRWAPCLRIGMAGTSPAMTSDVLPVPQWPNSIFKQPRAIGPVVMTARARPKLSAVFRAPGACPIRAALKAEGARNAGRTMRPQPHAQWKQAHECSHHESTGSSGVPHAVGFSACFVLSPATVETWRRRLRWGRRLRLKAHGADRISQDHTTWADAQRRCKWGESPPRSASRSVARQRLKQWLTRL